MTDHDYLRHTSDMVQAIKEDSDGETTVVDEVPNRDYYDGVFDPS